MIRLSPLTRNYIQRLDYFDINDKIITYSLNDQVYVLAVYNKGVVYLNEYLNKLSLFSRSVMEDIIQNNEIVKFK